jgi:hypothetical protein
MESNFLKSPGKLGQVEGYVGWFGTLHQFTMTYCRPQDGVCLWETLPSPEVGNSHCAGHQAFRLPEPYRNETSGHHPLAVSW